MEKIVPFKHEILFKTHISEITSISLEHTLHKEDNGITGEFIVSGEYKINDSSTTTEPFDYKIPFDIVLDEHYDISNSIIDINDFYYEILNEEKLVVNIEVSIDKIVENLIEVKKQVIKIEPEEVIEVVKIEEPNVKDNRVDASEVVEDIINVEETEEYVTYHIHIVRDGDTIDSVLEKYKVSSELLALYNNLNDIKIGDKLLIPSDGNK